MTSTDRFGFPRSTLHLAVLALPESGAMAASGLHEVLSATQQGDAPVVIRPVLVAPDAAPFRASNGLVLTPERALDSALNDMVVICDAHLADNETPAGRWGAETDWVRRHHEAGRLVASVCSGALLLAEAGLLDGGDAASHWSLAPLFRDRYPQVRFRPERILCASGPAGSLVTTGGASSWQDLALWLIARVCGAPEAARIARLFLIGDRGLGQLPFSSMARPRQHEDPLISSVQAWLVDHYAEPHPVTAMAARAGLSERTFNRRFISATGYRPVEYVQVLRIEEAKQVLEREDWPIEEVAALAGYEDAAFFRRLFRRLTGITPAQYRRRNRVPAALPRDRERPGRATGR